LANRIRRDDRSAVVRLEDGQSPGHVRCCVDSGMHFWPFVAIDLLKAFPRLFGHYLQTTCSRHLKIALCLSQNSPALRSPCSVRPGLWQRPRRRTSQIKKKPEWTADIGHCQVTIRHGGKTVSIVRSGLPNVEETRFVQEGGERRSPSSRAAIIDRPCSSFSTFTPAHSKTSSRRLRSKGQTSLGRPGRSSHRVESLCSQALLYVKRPDFRSGEGILCPRADPSCNASASMPFEAASTWFATC
jgi:hypothetical protein